MKKFLPEHLESHDEVGLVNGLAWTSVGGVMMPLEVLVLDGTGKTEFTGSLGDVMKESAKIAVSLTRSLAKNTTSTRNSTRTRIFTSTLPRVQFRRTDPPPALL